MPSAAEVRTLYRAFLKQGQLFPQYNIREYVKRRVREGFRTEVTAQNSSALDTVWKKAKSEFEVVKRQSVVYSLYAREHKSVMELPHNH